MEYINAYLLLVISVILSIIYGILRNYYSKRIVKTNTDYYAFNFLSSILTAIVLIIISGGIHVPSAYTIIFGIVFGISTAVSAILSLQALNLGPLSYTTVILTSAMIIPALSGRIFWDEYISVWQYVGILLVIISIFFSVDKKSGEKSTSVKWLMLCLVVFIIGGSIGIMQKIHQSSAHSDELSEFLLIAFIVSIIFSYVVYWIYLNVKKVPRSVPFSIKSSTFLISAACGICFALVNQINLYLSGVMNSAIFFPVLNGGSLIFTIVISIVCFKEKLTKQQWFGLIIGMFAIILLCNVIRF